MGLTQPPAPMSCNVSVLSLLDNNGQEREDGLTSLLPSTVRDKSFDEHQQDWGEENEKEEEDAHEDVHGLGHSDLQDIRGIRWVDLLTFRARAGPGPPPRRCTCSSPSKCATRVCRRTCCW